MVSAAPVIATTVSVFIVPISREFGWGRAEFPLAIMAAAWVGGLAAPLGGRALDRLGTKPVMIAGAVLFGLANIMIAFSDGVRLHTYPLYMLLGAASSFTGTFGVNKIVSVHFPETRGKALGLALGGGVGLGSAITPLLVQHFVQHEGWREAYIALGILVIAVTAPAVLFLTPNTISPTDAAGDPEAGRAPGLTARQAFRTSEFWLLLGLTIFNGFAAAMISGHWIPMQTERGVSIGLATALLSGFGLIKVFAQLGGGILLDRFQTPKLAMMILVPVFISACAYALAQGPTMVITAALLFGLGEGAELGLLPYLISRYFGVARFAEIYGYFAAAAIISGGLGNVTMGRIYDVTGGYGSGLGVGAALLLLAIAAAAFLGPYRFALEAPTSAVRMNKPAGEPELA